MPPDCAGVILGQNCVSLLDAALDDFFFLFNFFSSKQCKYAIKIVFIGKKSVLSNLFWMMLSISKITPVVVHKY